MVKFLGKVLFYSGCRTDDGLSLRRWFIFYVIYLTCLVAAAAFVLPGNTEPTIVTYDAARKKLALLAKKPDGTYDKAYLTGLSITYIAYRAYLLRMNAYPTKKTVRQAK